ncbi:hypothetical protein RH831_09465 [Halodesulfurarchaeum sp. HSR-GB]|uniref:DUF7475 family protein n=1 Tax=Halodesulfurarchaeum sp. HSR-GB TaxID=3074077 RepID=UPI002854DD20|nr:hypothetical protein [Halodesulfurarchaeum sp. HSR-GB]MDR5657407.1 hypothetical protein [Halodesulfurarchaeum sp. HSR-GB]
MATSTSTEGGLRTEPLTGLHWVGIGAALVSGAIHLLLGIRFFPSGLGISFLLAGLGFLGAIGLVLRGYRRRLVYGVGVPFVLVQLVLWYVINFASGPKSFPADVGTLGAIDKIAQFVLVGVLIALLRSSATNG